MYPARPATNERQRHAEADRQVLADPLLVPLLSNEGVMQRTRYEFTDFPADARPSPSVAVPGETVNEIRLEVGIRS
jgi:hypothetical protein